MRIAQVAPVFESVPPKQYGGTERVVHYLTEELVRQGHDVTLFASGDSTTRAQLVPVVNRALRNTEAYKDSLPYQIVQLGIVNRHSSRFDLVHFHTDFLHFPTWKNHEVPQLTTLHGRLDLPSQKLLYSEFREMPVVSISHAQRKPLGPLPNWVGNVYHGLPKSFGTRGRGERHFLAFLGRISPEKRLDRAIEISKQSGLPLMVGAKIDPADASYFHKVIEPLMSMQHVHYLGEVNDARKESLLSSAKALLFPIDWPEPFGLVMIEAMACGTPVIAYGHGSVPEILEHGKTGFIVDSIEDAVEAVHRLPGLDPAEIRKEFERRFSVERMARDYVSIFESLLDRKRGWRKESSLNLVSELSA